MSEATRRKYSDAAHDRLKSQVLIGLSIAGIFLGVGGATVASLAPSIDPDVAMTFVPDAVVGVVALVLLFSWPRRGPRIVIGLYTTFYVLNYAFFAVHAEGYKLFSSTTFVLMAPVFGYYLGGPRLGLWLSVIFAVEGATAVVVHHLGVGHRWVAIPPIDDPATQVLFAMGTIWVLSLVTIFERARHRVRRQLDEALGQLDAQGETLLTVVESQRDAVLLLDARHRVLLHNRAAGASLPALAVGVELGSLLPADSLERWEAAFATSAREGHARAEERVPTAHGVRDYEISFSRVSSGDRLIGFTLVARDLTERRAAESALRRMRGQLFDASRRAGRAEVAAALLHNLGNTLNGATVSASQLAERTRALRLDGVRKAAGLLRERADALTSAMGDKAPKLLAFLEAVCDDLERERRAMIGETAVLGEQIGSIAAMVAEHEKHARVREVLEEVELGEVVSSVLTEDEGLAGLDVVRQLDPGATLLTVRHRLLDVVVALLGHARLSAARRIAVTLRATSHGVRLGVGDEQPLDPAAVLALTRHGGALHDAALGATQLGGTLRRVDDSWVLELPRRVEIKADAA